MEINAKFVGLFLNDEELNVYTSDDLAVIYAKILDNYSQRNGINWLVGTPEDGLEKAIDELLELGSEGMNCELAFNKLNEYINHVSTKSPNQIF